MGYDVTVEDVMPAILQDTFHSKATDRHRKSSSFRWQ